MGKPVDLDAGAAGEAKGARGARGRQERDSARAPKALTDVREELEALFARPVNPLVFSGMAAIDDAESAARLLRNLVRWGTLKVDDQVPGNHFADAIGVHRNTMSKALKQLAAEGLLVNRRGRPARIVAVQAALPPATRRSAMISHTRVAREHHLEISTAFWDVRQCPLRSIDEGPRVRVAHRLELSGDDEVIEYSRIRLLSSEAHKGFPAIAEMAYFAAKRTPPFFLEGLEQPDHVSSIYEYLRDHSINPVNSEYLVRISRLPKLFVSSWAKAAHTTPSLVKDLPFLRLESTAHGPQGPLQYSVAFVQESLYVVSGTDLTVEIRNEALPVAEASPITRPEPVRGLRW